jgi:hypothetical protein
MAKFSVHFEKSAHAARDACCRTYGNHEEINEWLRSLVREVESNSPVQSSTSAEVGGILSDLLGESTVEGEEKLPSPWAHAWSRFRKAPFAEKARALLHTITSRKPPWELRVAFETFSFLSGAFSQRVAVYYEIDRTNFRIVFRQFDNLPGS